MLDQCVSNGISVTLAASGDDGDLAGLVGRIVKTKLMRGYLRSRSTQVLGECVLCVLESVGSKGRKEKGATLMYAITEAIFVAALSPPVQIVIVGLIICRSG